MAAKKQWSDFSQRSRRLLIVAGVAEAGLKAAALLDIRRRPASEIRGPKWIWTVAMVFVGSFGALPISYFALGRRR